jgi:hypothetical protein
MSTIEKIDTAIISMVEALAEEFSATGFLSAPSPERKGEIVEQIATLRASMSPQCDCKK